MKYDVKLISADIRSPLDGEMSLGLEIENSQHAAIEYEWTKEQFTARFIGFAPGMPAPAHPVAFINKPIEAINLLKNETHKLPTDVFKDTLVSITID
ncbi:MAG: hypothetical protein JKX94_07710 [Sneathiella sp.]|nr:hypothetical protein [Sneathiella sp.]